MVPEENERRGPDRRRGEGPTYEGPDRRTGDRRGKDPSKPDPAEKVADDIGDFA